MDGPNGSQRPGCIVQYANSDGWSFCQPKDLMRFPLIAATFKLSEKIAIAQKLTVLKCRRKIVGIIVSYCCHPLFRSPSGTCNLDFVHIGRARIRTWAGRAWCTRKNLERSLVIGWCFNCDPLRHICPPKHVQVVEGASGYLTKRQRKNEAREKQACGGARSPSFRFVLLLDVWMYVSKKRQWLMVSVISGRWRWSWR